MGFPNLNHLRESIARVFDAWEAYPSAISTFRIMGVRDECNDRYVLEHVDFNGERYATRLLASLEIRDGKIWILQDNTEDGIATELVADGIPKDRIVLAYYPPAVREIGEFAVT
jgi:hypothetical protein